MNVMWVPVTTAWHILRLPIWRVTVNIYRISSCIQLTRGGPPPWGLGKGITLHHKKKACYKNVTQGLRTVWILWTYLWIWLRMVTSGGLLWTW